MVDYYAATLEMLLGKCFFASYNSRSLYVCDREKNKKTVSKQSCMCWLWCLCEKVSCRSNTDERRMSSLEIGRM